MIRPNSDGEREPKVVGFVCNWNGYSGVEMAGVEGLEYSAGLRLVRVMCLGQLRLGIVLRAFELGADGVLLLGCPPQECHYGGGSEQVKDVVQEAKQVLRLLGADPKRVEFVEVPLGGSEVFTKRVQEFMDGIRESEPTALAAVRLTTQTTREIASCKS